MAGTHWAASNSDVEMAAVASAAAAAQAAVGAAEVVPRGAGAAWWQAAAKAPCLVLVLAEEVASSSPAAASACPLIRPRIPHSAFQAKVTAAVLAGGRTPSNPHLTWTARSHHRRCSGRWRTGELDLLRQRSGRCPYHPQKAPVKRRSRGSVRADGTESRTRVTQRGLKHREV